MYLLVMSNDSLMKHNLISCVLLQRFTAITLLTCKPQHFANEVGSFDIVGSVYHLVIYMHSNKIHNVVLMSKF